MISTGANLYHDLHYALNFTLRRGSPFVDDRVLYEEGVIRIYDVLFPAQVLLDTDTLHPRLPGDERHGRPGVDRGAARGARQAPAEGAARAARSTRSWPSAAKYGVPIYTSSPGDSSIGMNIAYHELINRSTLQVDPNKDVNEVCAIIRAAEKNGCVILGGGSPKNFYLQGQPTLWEVYGILKGGNDYFIQITTDSVVWGGLSGATPAEAVSWGKVNPSVLPDTAVAYCDSTIAFPLFCEYAVGHKNGRRPRKALLAQARRSWSPTSSAKRASRSRRRARNRITNNESETEWAHCGRSWGRSPTRSPIGRASMPTPTCRRASSRSCARRCGGTCCS